MTSNLFINLIFINTANKISLYLFIVLYNIFFNFVKKKRKMQIEEASFFSLIRLGLATEKYTDFPTLTTAQWRRICDMAGKQSMYGILMSGIETLPDEKRPPRDILLRLIKISCDIENKNRLLNNKVKQLVDYYTSKSFTPILLKGQGIATLYPFPYRRMPGDIDLWLPQPRRKVISFMKRDRPKAQAALHHIHYHDSDNIEVEIHTLPAYMFNPLHNFRFCKHISRWSHQSREVALPDTDATVSVPSDEMNLVFLLLHKYRHMLLGGIGLRQITDYMMLLRSEITDEERQHSINIIHELGLTTFCGAVMYVLCEYLGMESKYLLMHPNTESGRHLIEEIMTGGNFGQYDTRDKSPYTPGSFQSFIYDNRKLSRRFAREYSSEIRWLPLYKIFKKIWSFFSKY